MRHGQKLSPETAMKIDHGHTDTHVFVAFSIPVKNLLLTLAEVDAFLSAMQESKRMLIEHQAKG